MTHTSRIPEFLQHMVVACNRIAIFTTGKDENDFRSDLMLQGAVVHAIQIIGEAAVRIRLEDERFIEDRGLITFTRAIGMRNRLAHEYDAVDLEITWDTVVHSVPALREKVIQTLYDLGHRSNIDSLHF